MNCPFCTQQNHLEIDLHADGFSSDLIECTECGALLTIKDGEFDTVQPPTIKLAAAAF
jgi:Zn ribbon nucleic-acid-binding protein